MKTTTNKYGVRKLMLCEETYFLEYHFFSKPQHTLFSQNRVTFHTIIIL